MQLHTFFKNNFSTLPNLVQWGINAGIYITISGLFTSRFAIALGMIVMGSASFINIFLLNKSELKSRLKGSRLIFLSICLLFLSVITSFYGSEEMGFAWVRFKLYAAFFLLPLIVYFSPDLTKNHLKNYLLFALSGAIISTSLVLLHFFQNFKDITDSMGRGQPIPTPIPHIRYGMFVSFTFLLCIYAVIESFFDKKIKNYVIVGALFLLGSILVLSVRTAWLVTFAGIVSLMIYIVYKYKKIVIALAIVLLSIILGIGSYFIVPSFQNKVNYMLYDWKQYREGQGKNYSDSERVYSLRNGFSLWQQNRTWGVGSGDLHKSLEENGKVLNIPANQIPHNQFLLTAVCGGTVSLVIFLIGFVALMAYTDVRKSFPVMLLVCLYLLTLFFEPTFETSVGVLSFVFIVAVALKSENIGRKTELNERL